MWYKMAVAWFILILISSMARPLVSAPQPCKFPKQFEADVEYQYLGTRSTSSYHIFYDAYNRRERIIGEFDHDSIPYPEHNHLDIMTLWKQMKQYTHYTNTGDCYVQDITDNFSLRGVDNHAQWQFNATYGALGILGECIHVMTFQANQADEYLVEVTYPSCIPIKEQRYNTEFGYQYTRYYNVTLGIRSHNAWDPPKNCH